MPNEIRTLISVASATFVGGSVDSAIPTEHFAFPPYRLEPANPKEPDGLQCVMNANGFNSLSFLDKPGAKFAPNHVAQAIVERWNGVAEPKQSTWVGLTADEREQHRNDWHSNIHDKEFRAIEDKLEEKNSG